MKPMASTAEVTRTDIQRSYEVIRRYIRRTPALVLDGADFGLGPQLTLKLEAFQHTGSFKPRGAFTNMLLREVPSQGVVAASGGNHGAAVAYAAMKLNHRAKIFVPTVASPSKVSRIRSYGAELVITGDRYADALAASHEWIAQSGALPIHAYDQRETIIGQGTVGLELQDQQPELDTLLVAVGGGGLISGICSWYAGGVKIIGVEPELAPTLASALRAGEPVDAPAGGVAADSLAPKRVGELNFPIAKKYVDHMVLVSDESIVNAQKLLWDKVRIVTEPGGAAALAALISGGYKPRSNERVGVIVCGGNTDAVDFDKSSKVQGLKG